MWNPGFAYEHFETADLTGFHRSLCVYSWVWRGSPERPGLVFGLAPGGHCRGRVIGVPDTAEDEVLAYLDARELVTDVYERQKLPFDFADGRPGEAWSYIARPDHIQFAGDLDPKDALPFVLQGHGRGGANRDYILDTAAHLREMGIADKQLERLIHLI